MGQSVMAARKPLAASAASGARRRKPEGREERVLYHIGLEPDVAEDLDTLLWFQTQQYYRALRGRETKPVKPLKEELLDAAARAYLASARSKRPGIRSSTTKDVRLTFWLGASIAEQIDAIAVDLGVSAARVLDAAIRFFTDERVTPAAREFRKETEDRAARFVERMLNRE